MDKRNRALKDSFEDIIAAYSRRHEEKREKRLWKEIVIPCSLSDAINGLTKIEMGTIRKNLDMKNLSSLNKAELALKLTEIIPVKARQIIARLDQGRYDLLKAMAQNSGMLHGFDNITNAWAEWFLGHGIIFPGTYNNQKALYMPPEITKKFLSMDEAELKKIVKRNTEWIRLTQGLLYYYGVMGIGPVIKKIEQLTGQDVDYYEFIHVILSATVFYGQVKHSSTGLYDHRVPDPGEILKEQKTRPGVDYYPFTRQQLLNAGEPDYIDRTPALNTFLSFLSNNYDLNDEETKEIAMDLIEIANTDSKLPAMLEYLQGRLEFPSFDFLQMLTGKLTELYNNTRQWALKGHTPHELFQEEKKYLKPLPAEPFKLEQTNSKVVDIRTRTKIGRNDPCPCGSGKKYKRCCGK